MGTWTSPSTVRGTGRVRPATRPAVVGQVVAAAGVATLVSLPLLAADGEQALDLVRLELAGGIGLVAHLVARRSTTRRHAMLYAVAVVVVAAVAAVVKNVLLGH